MTDTGPVFPWDRLKSVSDYEVIDANLEQACADAIGVWRTTIGWPGQQEEVFRRHYLEYPFGKPELKFLRHVSTGAVVGTLGIGPRRVFWKGREIRVGMLSHFCVVAEHRKARPPMLLFKSTIDACRGRFDALYAIPGTPESAPHTMALQRMAAAGVTTSFRVRRVKVLRSAGYAARFLPKPFADIAGAVIDLGVDARDILRGGVGSVRAEWVESVSPCMAELWESTPRGDGWCAARDVATLRWRFDRLLSCNRRYLLVSDATGNLLAWFACDDNYFQPGILDVQDFWSIGGPDAINRVVIRVLYRAAKRLGFVAVGVRLVAPKAAEEPWAREGFVERNRDPVPIFWLNPDVAGGTDGPLHITEFDNDG